MKNTIKVLGTRGLLCAIVLTAVIGFSIAACDINGPSTILPPVDGPNNGPDSGVNPASVTYTSYDKDGNAYTLVVNETDNSYVLTITNPAGSEIGRSTGTVKENNEGTFTLDNGNGEFTVKVSGNAIEDIPQDIPLDNGETQTPPDILVPSNPNGNDGAFIGKKLEISGQQVYTMTQDPQSGSVSYIPYTENMTLTSYNGVTATIAGGKLGFTIGIPDNLETWNALFPSNNYAAVTISDPTAKGFIVDRIIGNFGGQDCQLNKRNRAINYSGTSVTYTDESIMYVYTDKNVTISGTGKTTTDSSYTSYTRIMNNSTLALKEGWNVVHIKEVSVYSTSSITVTTTISLSDPSSLKWILEKSDYITDGDYQYIPNTDESTVTIINYNGDEGAVTIPSQLGGKTVTGIGNNAFSNCTSLTSVNIPSSVTSIGDYAFYNTGLTSVTIPNSVNNIGSGAFSNCTGITSVTIPNSVTKIEDDAFTGCTGLASITIGNNVTGIGNRAFYGCISLINVTIPNSVIIIERQAFNGCSGLVSVTIGSNVTNIEEAAFAGCTSLVSVTFVNGSNIPSGNFGSAFPVGSEAGITSENLNNAYLAANPKAGTYTRESGGYIWTKQP